MAAQVLSELVTIRHLKLTNTTEIPHYFRLLVSRPFSVSQDGVSRSHRAPGPSWKQECKEGTAAAGKQLVLYPQENMLVSGPCLQWAHSPGLGLTFLSRLRMQHPPGLDVDTDSGVHTRTTRLAPPCAVRSGADTHHTHHVQQTPPHRGPPRAGTPRPISVDTRESQTHKTLLFVPSTSVLVLRAPPHGTDPLLVCPHAGFHHHLSINIRHTRNTVPQAPLPEMRRSGLRPGNPFS